jgi:20S proteasome subunit alpha 6
MSILKYDVDSVTWNPQGKLLQVDYAMEAVKQGSICLALCSETDAVLLAVKKNPTKLACYQEKIFKISDSIGIGISGMTGDARILCKYMRVENAKHQIKFNDNISVKGLAGKVSSIFHEKTYIYGKRPFGVGLLMVGYNDEHVPQVFEINPAGECIQYQAYAIGAKSQSTKTYIEKFLPRFKKATRDELIMHGLAAIKAGYRDEAEEMSEKNIELSVLTRGTGFSHFGKEELRHKIDNLANFKPDSGMDIEH